METTPILSFITVTYNGYADTCCLIRSLEEKVRSVSYEIIVVDNASKVNEAARLQQEYPHIITIRSEKNLGFAGGNNLGIPHARGTYLFFINNDTYMEQDHIPDLISRLESSPAIGGVSPKIRFAFPPQHIQFAGFTPLSYITLRNASIGCGQTDDGSYDHPARTPYLHGAAMLIKKEIFAKTGWMPEIYFLYYEELDWCTTMTRAGYELWYEPRCTVFHKESQSTGQESPLRTYYMTRNRLLYAWRNCGFIEKILSVCYQLLVAFPKNLLGFLSQGRTDLCMAACKGVIGFLTVSHKTD
ncbi:MAG: glycosyltransferase family 2 protein [Bacteroides sp.]|nr:glycosyltransferase family 2 protein [Bacteroides sp.]